MGRRIFLGAATATLVALVVYAIWSASVSDETRVRWLLQDAVQDFNATSKSCMTPLADDWRDTTVRELDRATLSRAITALFFRFVDAKSKAFTLHLTLPEDTLQIDTEAGTATFELHLDEAGGALWHVRVDAQLEQVDGAWRVRRSSHETLQGRRPR